MTPPVKLQLQLLLLWEIVCEPRTAAPPSAGPDFKAAAACAIY